jgi:hypothetical protein
LVLTQRAGSSGLSEAACADTLARIARDGGLKLLANALGARLPAAAKLQAVTALQSAVGFSPEVVALAAADGVAAAAAAEALASPDPAMQTACMRLCGS